MNEPPLIQTETNQARENKGFAFGLEGDLFLYVIGAITLGIMTGAAFFVARMPSLLVIGGFFFPVVICIAYLKIFRIKKPPHYQQDLMEQWFSGGGSEKPSEEMKTKITELKNKKLLIYGGEDCIKQLKNRG